MHKTSYEIKEKEIYNRTIKIKKKEINQNK